MKHVYIEVRESELLLGFLKKSQLFFVQRVPFNYGHIHEAGLANISHIFKNIINYLRMHKISTKRVIVCVPFLLELSSEKQKMFVFQIALCVSKMGLKIKRVISDSFAEQGEDVKISKKQIESKLDFFEQFRPPHKRQPYAWITFVSVFSILLISSFFVKTQKDLEKHDLLLLEHAALSQEVSDLQKLAKVVRADKNEVKKLTHKIEKCDVRRKNIADYKTLMSDISQHVPARTWVEQVLVKTDNKSKEKHILIDGFSFDEKEAIQFNKALLRSNIIKNIELSKLDRTDGKFSFKLGGRL